MLLKQVGGGLPVESTSGSRGFKSVVDLGFRGCAAGSIAVFGIR